jgi:hypothetical protein
MARVLINLHSEQAIPNYIAIKEIRPDKVVALTTDKYTFQIPIFEKITNSINYQIKRIDAYDIEKNFEIIQDVIINLSVEDEVYINYTGGTKVMVVSVILKVLLSTNQKLSFVYVNTFGNMIEYLDLSKEKSLAVHKEEISTRLFLETYVNLKGERLKAIEHKLSKKIEERIALSEQLLLDNSLIKIFNKQKSFFNGRNVKREHRLIGSNYELYWNTEKMGLNTLENKYEYDYADGGIYFAGGWLEEYVFFKLYNSEYFDKTIANVKFNFTSFNVTDKTRKNSVFKNEIDVVVTKGLKTVFIECKAGNVTQDYVYKLKSIKDHFLGTFGVAVLVTKFKQPKNIIEKCKDANIIIISDKEIEDIADKINNIV